MSQIRNLHEAKKLPTNGKTIFSIRSNQWRSYVSVSLLVLLAQYFSMNVLMENTINKYIYKFRTEDSFHSSSNQNRPSLDLVEKSRKRIYYEDIINAKKIIYWNSLSWNPTFHLGFGRKPFTNCKFKNCYLTDDRTEFPMEDLDAIIWRYRSHNKSMPIVKNNKTKVIFFLKEAVGRMFGDFPSNFFNGLFHWTMTYRSDSDVNFRYGYIIKRATAELSFLNADFHQNKTKMAAWFVSNCISAPSGRLRLAETLQKYINVDIYGQCGNLKCDRDNHCYEMVEKEYLFYLSFENSLCKDYITEKLFRILKIGVIPVVFGLGPYQKYLPPKSYIDVFDFTSVAQLSNYLLYLSKNTTAYNEYFRWKSEFEVNESVGELSAACSLCQTLNVRGEQSVPYLNIEEVLTNSAHCRTSQDYYVSRFINGVQLPETINSILSREFWRNETFIAKSMNETIQYELG